MSAVAPAPKRSDIIINAANIDILRNTMLAVCLEVKVTLNQDGSGTGCWILSDAAITRIRNRHGNFSFAQRGGTAASTTYWSARLVGESGNSPFYLIHHIATTATGVHTQYLNTPGLEASHLCNDTRCWNPYHIWSESRSHNLARRYCAGNIVDRDGGVVHNCLCRGLRCIRSQNVRFQAVIDVETVRVHRSIMDLQNIVKNLKQLLSVSNLTIWRINPTNNRALEHYWFQDHYWSWTPESNISTLGLSPPPASSPAIDDVEDDVQEQAQSDEDSQHI